MILELINILAVYSLIAGALLLDLEYMSIPDWIPIAILAISLPIQIGSHGFIEPLTALIFFFGISLFLYKANAYSGGDHKLIASLGPLVVAQGSIQADIISALLFFGVLSIAGIISGLIYKGKEKPFMPEIAIAYFIWTLFAVI